MLWLWNFFLDRKQFSYVLIATLVLAGLFSVLAIPKENSPSIVIPNGIVTTALPGASAQDIETLVTNKLEDQVSGLNNLDTVTSVSSEGVSVLNVQFDANADVDKSIQELRDAVAKAVPNLPSDATTPQVSKIDFSNQPVLVVSIAGDLPPTEFSALATEVSDDIKHISGVSEVRISGMPERQVTVVVSKEKLQQYGLRLTDIISSISSANASAPAGSISMSGVNYNVSFKGNITDPSEIQNIAVGIKNKAPIYVRDIAVVSDGLASASSYSRLSVDGKPSSQAISLTIYKQTGAEIKEVANAAKAEMLKLQETKLKGMNVFISPSTDQGVQITKQLGDLTETGLETVVLVMIVLLLTIGWRESVVAALAIPLSFLIAFIGLHLTGNTLNFISLFALILAVGILVDSGIVVTEAIHARMKLHSNPLDAAKHALRDYAWPLIAGTMATVAVFAPLFFISGIVGKFIAGIPYTLIFVLIASIFVALGIVPLIAVLFTKKHSSRFEEKQEEYTERATEWYKEKLRLVLENKRWQRLFLRGLGVLFVLAMILPFTGLVQTVFFPQDDQDFVYVNIQAPEGTTLGQTDLIVRQVEELLYPIKDISSLEITTGQSSGLTGGGSSGSNQANITVNLPLNHKKTSTEIATELQQVLSIVSGANIQVLQANNGPSSGAPIQIQFEGNNLDELITAAEAGKQLVLSIPHTTNVTDSTQNNGTQFDLTVDRGKATALGLSTVSIAQTLRAAVQGTKATSITQPKDDIDVVVKLNLNTDYIDPSDTTRTTIDAIKNLSVQGTNGPVLLGSVLQTKLGVSNAAINHKDKSRLETVSAYPDDKTTSTAVIAEFKKRIEELHLPPGVIVSYGGETEDINQSFTDMFIALIAGLVLMFMILIICFNSIRYTWYLLVIVPLSLIGVLGGLAITGQPVSLTSLLGVIALGGVIINHAIILMDSMIHHLNAEKGRPIIDIVIESSATRLRPIVLTTITTVVGMIPLAMSNATWGPLAFAVMFGLTFAICLTLVLVPMLFYRYQMRIAAKH
ncbi:efflux RND transporter permease subunit [Patescibacteria group bacterium]|nr:efflux RND transporter permease subunit [Patescibacteria group bacterium]